MDKEAAEILAQSIKYLASWIATGASGVNGIGGLEGLCGAVSDIAKALDGINDRLDTIAGEGVFVVTEPAAEYRAGVAQAKESE